MREEADEAWRNVDPKRAVRHHAKRDLKLLAEVEDLLGPNAWNALGPAKHIAWNDQAICHWTFHAPAHWPPTQTAVKIADLIARLPCADDETYVEFIARPDVDWNGVTCDACRIRLPTLLRELGSTLDDLQEGIMEGFRTHPDTLRAQELYERDVEPTLTAAQRQRRDAQAQQVRDRNARRSARRARLAKAGTL
jgi:hypothetical protein